MQESSLKKLIDSLTKEEIRNFKLYIKRLNTVSSGDKRSTLFDLMKEGKIAHSEKELQEFIYPNNRNAYYKLKNKLRADIEESLLILHRQRDKRFPVYKRIELSHVFRYKSEYTAAFEYLLKAEKLAEKMGDFELLGTVYTEILSLATDYYRIDPEIYIQKRQENINKNKHIQQANFLIATVNYRLWNSNFSGKEIELTAQLDKLQNDLMIDPEIAQTPYVQLAVNKCVRTVLLQNKEFAALEDYLLESIDRFEELNWFGGQHLRQLFIHLNWLINVSAVNLKFEQALKYSELLSQALDRQKGKFKGKFQWIYHQSMVMNLSFLGNNDEVIEILQEVIDDKNLRGSTFYDVFAYLNLAVSYYNADRLGEALQTLTTVLVPDIYDPLPRNLQLGISIVEIVLHYEKEDLEFVEHCITDKRRKFRKELKTESYQREKEFLTIIRLLVTKVQPFRNETIAKRIELFLESSPPFQPGSNEAINYSLWLRAKLSGQPYYQLVLKEIDILKESQLSVAAKD